MGHLELLTLNITHSDMGQWDSDKFLLKAFLQVKSVIKEVHVNILSS